MSGDRSNIGFTWGSTENLYWLRTENGDYKRIDPTFLETLKTVARGDRGIETLTEGEQRALSVLHEQEYIRDETPVKELPTPAGITLWPRLLAFGIVFTLVTVYVGYRLIDAPETVPALETGGTIEQLLLSIPVFGVMAVIHEAGHYLAARPYFDPSIRLRRLNGVFPALVTTTNGAWRCPKSVRIWISIAGPLIDLCQCLVLAGISLLIPGGSVVSVVVLFGYVRILCSLNPLVRGDGYWILVDWWDSVNLRSRGMADLKAGQLTVHACFALGSLSFTVLSIGVVLFVGITSLNLGK
ncbi:hypothetical protein [Halocatena salina]|uniref:Uncharacterized protein n=1 Tax=Halocatena salina TaxID=2934340 RepID=A0A8U0A7M0_9EURY|nr:hypothetical protein [Halocatena salina]UPM45102.1 hypothetical protein MW046_17220 [Halocatena salina]